MEKIVGILASRKFWSLIISLVAVLAGYSTGDVSAWQAVQAAVAALAAYAIGTGIEAAGATK